MGPFESALRAAIRGEAAGPVAALAAALGRLASQLSGEPQPVRAVRLGGDTRPTQAAAEHVRVTPAPAAAPAARACAVIGCKQPHRSQGYCAAHYQKRRLMVATGRLHAAWVEGAAPHSIPDVILPRGRRPRADVEAPSPKPPVSATPRMWVRKKGELPPGPGGDGALALAPGAPPPPAKLEASSLSSESERATAAAQRWAREFRDQKRSP